ncbi:substrate-binding domain-containing protein [Paenibacillus frigoriresistens]|uniref:substrate-binding domain-containing protein n=1 Tax=Paenibacillus alginolyticus TaxID=59839 RepID=UPI0015632752|nr:substrate-binding domain-containing protein [Paenibacillus frigoriresistens]NRF93751.1 substrate-binding domain-containing protein [Paenibacillus frigoriresistens]
MRKHIWKLALAAVIMIGAGWTLLILASSELRQGPTPILFVPKTMDKRIEFWQVLMQGMNSAAKEYDAEIQVVGPDSESDIDGQIHILENVLTEKPKVMILAANDYEKVVPAAQKIKATGTQLITVDSGLDSNAATSFIATDNYEAGIKAGRTIQQLVSGKATIAVMNTVNGSATAMERERGLRDSLKDAKDIHLIDTHYNGGLGDLSYAYTQELLRQRNDIDGFVCLNESSTVGVSRAMKDLMMKNMKVVGFDSSMYEISFLEEGILQATVVQKPFNMGFLAVEAAVKAYKGEKISSRIDTGSEVITKNNMYTKENQKLLFPFVEK